VVSRLAQLDPDDLWRALDPDPQRAAEKLEDLRARLTKFFEWRRCDSPEDLAQETILRGLRKIVAGAQIYTDDPVYFFFGIAKMLVLEDRRAAYRQQQAVPLVETDHAVEPMQAVDTRLSLEQALGRLSPADREFFRRYHFDREALLSQHRSHDSAVRVRAHRILSHLRKLIAVPRKVVK
jgi:DNA-directed RNA polymerase specialized sigma24 family protein